MQREEQLVIDEFARRRARQLRLGLVVFPVAMMAVWLKHSAQVDRYLSALSVVLLTIVAAAALVFSITNWRCPACNVYLGKRANPGACPKCGARLRH
jgi:hypothetical protein